MPLPPLLRAVLLAAVMASLFHAWRMHLGARRITAAMWRPEGDWHLTSADGMSGEATLAPECYVSPYAVVLRFQGTAGRVRTLVILADALDADTLRRLRVRLRITAAPVAPPPPVRG
ncbi:MAG: protein YgfX [Thiohalomonadaceae bacterium]